MINYSVPTIKSNEDNILFVDIGDVLTIKDRTREGNDIDEDKLKVLESIIKTCDFKIVWITSWIRHNEDKILERYLKERNFKYFDKVLCYITEDPECYKLEKDEFDLIKIDLVKKFIELNKIQTYLIIDSDKLDSNLNFLATNLDGLNIKHAMSIRKWFKSNKNEKYIFDS